MITTSGNLARAKGKMFPPEFPAAPFEGPTSISPVISTTEEGRERAESQHMTVTTLKTRRRIGTAVRILDGVIIAMVLVMIIEAFGIRF